MQPNLFDSLKVLTPIEQNTASKEEGTVRDSNPNHQPNFEKNPEAGKIDLNSSKGDFNGSIIEFKNLEKRYLTLQSDYKRVIKKYHNLEFEIAQSKLESLGHLDQSASELSCTKNYLLGDMQYPEKNMKEMKEISDFRQIEEQFYAEKQEAEAKIDEALQKNQNLKQKVESLQEANCLLIQEIGEIKAQKGKIIDSMQGEISHLKSKNKALQRKVLNLGAQKMKEKSMERLRSRKSPRGKHLRSSNHLGGSGEQGSTGSGGRGSGGGFGAKESTLMIRNRQLRDEIERVYVN